MKYLLLAMLLPLISTTAQAADYTNSIGMEFVPISEGYFLMGSAASDKQSRSDEKPQHKVTISKPFYIGKYEVTQAQWRKIMGKDAFSMERTRGSSWDALLATGRFYGDSHPVTISWQDAQEFIARLNKMEGHNRYRLPSEAEWEYAARASSSSKYHFGDDMRNLSDFAWYAEDFASGSTHPVGEKKPNAWGLYDIHGNVWEWVNDWYDPDYYATSPDVDPLGPDSGLERVVRGGSWHQTADGWYSAFRKHYPQDYRGISIGFRILLEMQEK